MLQHFDGLYQEIATAFGLAMTYLRVVQQSAKSQFAHFDRVPPFTLFAQRTFLLTAGGICCNIIDKGHTTHHCSYYHDADTGFYYLQSRYYDPAIGRFINAGALVSTGQGLLGFNMFTYCLNNPIVYLDSKGQHAMMPPFVVNGLDLPPEGGIPVIIEGVLYYYATWFNSAGELYEFWFNANGDLVHVRHHSTHRTPTKHKNPHDHTGRRDDKGNNTQSKGPEPVDDKFQAPDKNTRDDTTLQTRFPTITFPQINSTQNVRSFGGGGGYICVDLVAGMFVGTLVGRFVITKAYAH